MEKDVTKVQWNSAKIFSLSLIGGFAAILLENDRGLSTGVQVATGIAFGLFAIYEAIRFIKVTYFGSSGYNESTIR